MNNYEAQQLLASRNVITDPSDHRTPQEIAHFLGLVSLENSDANMQIQAIPDTLTEDKL